MLQTFRERLTLLLLALLPLHALLVTMGTKLFAGAGQRPLMAIAVWKDVLLGLILFLACMECLRLLRGKKPYEEWISSLETWQAQKRPLHPDVLDWLIVVLGVLSMIVTQWTHGDWMLFAFGFKYDFLPLVSFLVLRRVAWSEQFRRLLRRVLLTIGGLVAAYGLLALVLPQAFFRLLGYNDLHSLYVTSGPLAPFQHIGGMALRRLQSTLSGPNQAGLWLLVPWSMALTFLCACRRGDRSFLISALYTLLLLGALLLTFSRSAWIAAVVVLILALWLHLPRDTVQKLCLRLFGVAVLFVLVMALFAPDVLFRAASTGAHLQRVQEGVQTMRDHPLGLGLGTAGPASHRVSDTCVFLSEEADVSWAENHPELCVFNGGEQVQPANRSCRCPFLPENWFLQIGVELGVTGFLLFVVLTLLLLLRLFRHAREDHDVERVAFLAFLGVTIAGLFLHAWESAAVAYSVWVLVAVAVPPRNGDSEP